MKIKLKQIIAAAALTLASGAARAQTASPVQSDARPFGLDIVAPVQLAGSDAASATFQTSYLPDLLSLVNERLGESVSQQNVATMALDPTKLKLTNDSAVRVYFLGEGAGYLNTLGFNTLSASDPTPSDVVVQNNGKLIFPNASSQVSAVGGQASNQVRTQQDPLLPGDFVNLGNFTAGTLLDFFLISNGAGGGYAPFSADVARNQDNTPHVVSFAVADSPYLIIGFEDLWGGGDRDFNDLVFAVNIGAQNVKHLISAPEPTMLLTMGGFLGMAVFGRRRSRTGLAAA